MQFDTRIPAGMVYPASAGPDLAGKPLPQDLFDIELDFTAGNGNSLGLAGTANATRSLVLTVDQDAHLLLVGGTRVITDVATDATQINFIPALFTAKMSSSGREMMNTPVHVEAKFGTAQLPAAWARPKFLSAGSSMKVTVQNLSAATQFNLRLFFHAFKIFLS